MLLVPEEDTDAASVGSVGFAASTDNQGNARLIDKHMTTKLPLSFVLLEQLQARSMVLELRWLARDLNQPADDLTNFRFEDVDAEFRVPVVWAELEFKILRTLSSEASNFSDQLSSLKASSTSGSTLAPPSSRAEKLSTRGPW